MAERHKGVFIAIEGTDGSGKGTQFKLLSERLKTAGYTVSLFDFPQYDSESSYYVRQYLNGAYGTADEVGPYTASLFYALDRYQAAAGIQAALDAGHVVLANRFSGSNMAHQGTKFPNAEQRRGYFIWLDGLEFQMLGIPRPDISLVLRVPAEVAQKLVDRKEKRGYTDKKRDIHEADLSHMQRSVEVYDDMCQLFPKDFLAINCVKKNELLSVPTISNMVWDLLKPKLEKAVKGAPAAAEVSRGKGEGVNLVEKLDDRFTMTQAGIEALQDLVTNTDKNVYAFSDKISATTIAAAMARLSRRGDDMRITLLDEFMGDAGKDEKLLQRVITAYGDDSVQQLVGQHVVVENASNLLTKKLEWGRMAAYLEQSTRYIYFDQKDEQGKYKYFTPTTLKPDVRVKYDQTMDQIFDLYSNMVRKLTTFVRTNSKVPKSEQDVAWQGATRAQACDAIRAVLPVAVKATVGIYASGQALESLIMHLLADEQAESRATGQLMLDECRKVMATFLERADKPKRGGARIAYDANTKKSVKTLAIDLLKDTHGGTSEQVTLTNYWPKNELDLVSDILYEHSDLPLKDIQKQVGKWSYDQKSKVFDTFIGERLNRRHKPGRALENAHYSWDMVCDYGIFRDLQRHRMVDDMNWQALTPRYGYETPDLVVQAGLTENFEKCFMLSAGLYSYMQSEGHELEAQYATLLGHQMRWKVTYNAREAFHFHELRTAPQGHPGYRKLVGQMHEKLAEVHPLMAKAMKFVNKDEDAELTRLAAERATQFKLSQI